MCRYSCNIHTSVFRSIPYLVHIVVPFLRPNRNTVMCSWIVLSASGGTPLTTARPHIKVRPLSSINQRWNLPIFTRVKITRVTRVKITRMNLRWNYRFIFIHIFLAQSFSHHHSHQNPTFMNVYESSSTSCNWNQLKNVISQPMRFSEVVMAG